MAGVFSCSAAMNHESANKFLPTGGWGWFWAGDPDRGYSDEQPGGWYYNSLDYLEQSAIRRVGSDGNAGVITPTQFSEGARRIATPLNEYVCPSRPGSPTKPYSNSDGSFSNITVVRNSMVARNDYAANAGDRPPDASPRANWTTGGGSYTPGGQGSPAAGVSLKLDRTVYSLNFVMLHDYGGYLGANGVVGAASELQIRQVEDGTTNTIWVGEKYIPMTMYDTGAEGSFNYGNDQGWDCAADHDNLRWTMDPPKPDEWVDVGGLGTQRSIQVFGSAHTAGCQFVYLDGSGHMISYDVNPRVFHSMGNRYDGEVNGSP